MNEKNLSEWMQVKKGDVVIIKDAPALEQNIDGVPLTVSDIERIKLEHCSIRIFHFAEKTDRLVLKYVDQTFDLRYYYVMDWVGEGARSDVLNAGHYFFFQNPGKDDFDPAELKWAEEFPLNCGNTEITFQKITGSELYGEITYAANLENNFIGVVEYKSTEETSDPYIFVMEVGQNQSFGGWITPLEGHSIKPSDIEVLNK